MNDIVAREAVRIVDSLAKSEPGTERYSSLLDNLNKLRYINDFIRPAGGRIEDTTATTGVPAHVKAAVEEALGLTTEDTPAPEAKPEPKHDPKPEPDPDASANPEDGRSYTKEEVRAALAESRKRGVKVTELLGELGYDNFSAVPAGEYGAVMAKLGEA